MMKMNVSQYFRMRFRKWVHGVDAQFLCVVVVDDRIENPINNTIILGPYFQLSEAEKTFNYLNKSDHRSAFIRRLEPIYLSDLEESDQN